MHDKKDHLNVKEYQRFSQIMDKIQSFIHENPEMTYIEFDHYIVQDMTLFSIDPNFDFSSLIETIHVLKKAMPSIKRIFNKPIIILKDTEDILPVENTRIINQKTFLHLANHSHHVSNINALGRVKPRKLLTRLYDDDYSIYENIIFCHMVDDVLTLLRKNRRTLENLIYVSESMKFNLLEKVNHMNYFLALGKLHTGYIREFKQYYRLAKELSIELSSMIKVIKPRLRKAIYQQNKKKTKYLALKKTNIFMKQKDYRQVFTTYKYLLNTKKVENTSDNMINQVVLSQNYLLYVQLLMLFSIGHFNFEVDPNILINLEALNVEFANGDWLVHLKSTSSRALILTFKKELTYRMLVTNKVYETHELKKVKSAHKLDEVVVVSPETKDYLERTDIFISLDDIDSFRRLQQIILRGMIYSDQKRNICPFCGELLHEEHHSYFICHSCRLQIKEGYCEKNHQNYFYTDNQNSKVKRKFDFGYDYDKEWYAEKQIESLMFFRNITKINGDGEIVCPHCQDVHGK